MTDPAVALLRELVAINSVNPSLVPGAPGEGAVQYLIGAQLRRLGIDVETQFVAEGRSNVVGIIDGRRPGPSLMLCGHVDTVGVEGMDAPFTPVERDGRLYARGAQDMKGGVAAILDAARVLTTDGLPAGRVIVAAVVDEEYASAGADALVTQYKADAAVVTEPTDLQIAVAHKGFAWFEVKTAGLAAHGSRPGDGRDAILRMGRVLHELEALDRRLQAGPSHDRLGPASLHASLISGGRELSSYPDECVLRYERRTLPGEGVETVREEIGRILDGLRAADDSFEGVAELIFARPAYELPPDHRLATEAVLAASTIAPSRSAVCGMSFWTDAAILGQAGIPSILFGPGGAGLHSLEEYVTLDDVTACRDVLVELTRRWCGQ